MCRSGKIFLAFPIYPTKSTPPAAPSCRQYNPACPTILPVVPSYLLFHPAHRIILPNLPSYLLCHPACCAMTHAVPSCLLFHPARCTILPAVPSCLLYHPSACPSCLVVHPACCSTLPAVLSSLLCNPAAPSTSRTHHGLKELVLAVNLSMNVFRQLSKKAERDQPGTPDTDGFARAHIQQIQWSGLPPNKILDFPTPT